ncbi:putative biopolymer transport ExbB-like protein [Herbaspirillum rubrisubalbicans M1]|uniref:MotA/TolQ/ExbB proton channel family protein n=1 Tax=Herbaspirillum rubrisubalbicans TaxID=80842 RepID=UPI00073A231D|nr:MotA/TolQ/ExbB proton channel family protein [Herbaspirillum rubrisubalbicans]ALU88170.1 putative biopolymer transport ExbB-like protein [Herbaspirillum rubrisubalbicans M1]
MDISHLLSLANGSGGTLYLMLVLLLVALTVIVERTRYLANMQLGGNELIEAIRLSPQQGDITLSARQATLPHARLFEVLQREPAQVDRATLDGHLEEAIMHEVPGLDRSLWLLDTVVTLAPLLGLFGTIIGMFNAFHVLGDVQNGASQVTGGIAEALVATASGLFIAMIGLAFFNALHTRVRIVLHQLETIKIMLVNRHEQRHEQRHDQAQASTAGSPPAAVRVWAQPARA